MRLVLMLVVFVSIALLTNVHAQAQFSQRDVKTRLAEEYIKRTMLASDMKTEIKNQIDSVMPQLLEQSGLDDPKAAKLMRSFIDEALASVDMQSVVVQSIVETYTEEEIRALTTFASSPVGKSIQRKSFAFSRIIQSKMESSLQEVMPNLIRKLIDEVGK